MTDSRNLSYQVLAQRVAGGMAGGFVWGAFNGLLDSLGFLTACRLGLFTLLAGGLAATVGHFLFRSTTPLGLTRSVINWAVIAVVFIGVGISFVPSDLVDSVGMSSMPGALVGAAGGGAFGGLFYELLRRRTKVLDPKG